MKEIKKLKSQYIVLAGPMGVGKSTFTNKMAKEMNFIPFYERPNENPYLSDYYEGKPVSFEMQQFFLCQFWEQSQAIKECIAQGHNVVQDRCVYEVFEIFSKLQHKQGAMTDHQLMIQEAMGRVSFDLLPKPDLILHLDAPTNVLLDRIKGRGRGYEQEIAAPFVNEVRSMYARWMETLIDEGAYLEGSGITPKQGRWSGTRVMELKQWGMD